jgi:hypothetical protein
MRIRADFVVTPAAHRRLIELGHKHVSRMSGHEGWGVSVEVPDKMFLCTDPGSVHHASRWTLRTKTLHVIWVHEKWNSVTEVMEPAHAEAWDYVMCQKYGTKVGNLPGWTEEDCK